MKEKEKTLLLARKKQSSDKKKQNYRKYMRRHSVEKKQELTKGKLHDNVGHVLSRTILLTGAARAINKDQNLDSLLKGLDNSLNSAMDSIRSSVHDLYDDAVNLQETIKGIITDIKIENVEFEYGYVRNNTQRNKILFYQHCKRSYIECYEIIVLRHRLKLL